VSVTISDAERFMETPREKLAADLWKDVAALTNLPDALPSWRVIKEKRATFAATPEETARRPSTATRWRNLLLAGDYVNTGLPATIEGAVRSGDMAAEMARERVEG
jgi:uncharacterized protein with NAD-binding domain and iron-sulfur cluster